MIVDFHTHIFPPHIIKDRGRYIGKDATLKALFSDPKAPMATADDLIAAMDEAEVDMAVTLGVGWTNPNVAHEANDYLLESAALYPQRLVAFCSVNPTWGEKAIREVERCATQGARGVGELHPDTQGFDLSDSQVMNPLVETARAHRLVLLTHASEPVGHQYAGKGDPTPTALMGFIDHSPDLPIVCAHWGGGLPFYALMPEIRSALVHTYFDTATSPLLYDQRVFPVAVQLLGATSILLGSDYPLLKPQRLIRQLTTASLTDEAKDAILGGNAQRILGLIGKGNG